VAAVAPLPRIYGCHERLVNEERSTVPIYEYECKGGHRFERRQGFHDDPLRVCVECDQPVRRLLSAPGIIFKGSGWYITDSRPAQSSGESSSGEAASTTTETKSETSTPKSEASTASGESTPKKSDSPPKKSETAA
jgi:putative FmdB family regulatory protein